MTTHTNSDIRFRQVSFITLLAVYFLILVGGVVRSTGSGMGCPDWPKCFDSWVPPTSVDQLPANYQEKFAQKRALKNQKLSGYLKGIGFDDLAVAVGAEKLATYEATFNATKTWIEYLNRLLGAIIGLLVFATAVMSLKFWKTKPWITLLAVFSVLLTGVQGWIGSVVVSTNLLPWMITVHMFLALAIIGILTILFFLAKDGSTPTNDFSRQIKWLLPLSMLLLFIQIALGTQVRELVNVVAVQLDYLGRDTWIESIGLPFLLHRSFSLFVFGINLLLVLSLRKSVLNSQLNGLWKSLLLVLFLEIISGVGMAYFAIPAFLQPIHLLFAFVAFGLQLQIGLELFMNSQKELVQSRL